MSIKGFKLSDGTVEKYDFLYLDDIDVQLQHLGSDVLSVLNNKANIDGSYINLNAGTANNLNSSVGIEEQTPYNFRTSGGSTEIGDREELNAVVGVSVPRNQLVQNGNFSSNTNWSWRLSDGGSIENNEGKLIAVNTSANNQMFQNITLPENRKFLVTFSARKGADNSFSGLKVALASNTTQNVTKEVTLGTTKADYAVIMTHTAPSGNLRFSLSATSLSVGDTAYISNVNLIDLTLALGSTIADYIYALEQSNAGAGVAYFRKLFPKPYYAYNSGALLSAQTNLHKMVGFNQWDEEWQNGYYVPTTGAFSANNQYICSKNPIHIFPATTYYIKTSGVAFEICEYDANGVFLRQLRSSIADATFTTDSDAHYIQIGSHTSGAMTNYDPTAKPICINFSWDGERDGEYEPYVAHEYALDDITLRGILKLGANNNLYADGDRYLPDGTVDRRYGVVDLGTLTWTKISDGVFSNSTNNGYKIIEHSDKPNMICSKYITETWQSINNGTQSDKSIHLLSGSSTKQICVFDSAYTDKDTFTAAMSGVYLVFELETPTTESADPYQQTQIVDDFGTEEFVDAAFEANERDVAIPVGHETFYQNNLKAKLEMAPNSPDGDGLYVVQQISGENTYVPLIVPNEIPDAPTTDGTYVLKASVSDGTVTYSWVAE